MEIGYAPETPASAASGFDAPGDTDGLAWNMVASGIDIWPEHSVGVNYGRTGTGWLLSPQYLPNSELFELRYQWQSERWPLLEARIRWQEDMDKPAAAQQKLSEFDFYLRLTWEFKDPPPGACKRNLECGDLNQGFARVRCHSEMKIISFINEADVIRKILEHLNLWEERSLVERAPPDSIREKSYEPYDDGWPHYEEPGGTVH